MASNNVGFSKLFTRLFWKEVSVRKSGEISMRSMIALWTLIVEAEIALR